MKCNHKLLTRTGLGLIVLHLLLHEVPTLLALYYGPEILTFFNLGL